jgi:hypothetical protein
MGTEHARDFAGTAILTDDANPLATRSARIGRTAIGLRKGTALFAKYEPLSVDGDGLDPVHVISRLVANGAGERALHLVESIADPTTRRIALGWARIDGAPRGAAAAFRRALAENPGADAARFGLLRVMRRQIEAGDPGALELAAPLAGTEGAVATGWRHAALGEWEELRALEPLLAAADPRDLAWLEALRLRVRWRSEGPDPAVRAEGAEIALVMLQSSNRAQDLILAASALAAADQATRALALIDQVSRSQRRPGWLAAAVAVLDEIRPQVDAEEWEEVRRHFGRRGR